MLKRSAIFFYSMAAVSTTSSAARYAWKNSTPTSLIVLSLGTYAKKATAFSTISSPFTRNILSSRAFKPLPISTHSLKAIPPSKSKYSATSSRLFSYKQYNNNENDDNIFKKLAKKVLPKSMFETPEEKQIAIQRKQQQDSIEGGLNTLLQDFPLPIRMMGRALSPMLSDLATEMQKQSEVLQDVLEVARMQIINSPQLQYELGPEIMVSAPFRQSSSSMSINGQTTNSVQASFEVRGSNSMSSGLANLVAENGIIKSLVVNVNGYQIDITNDQFNSNSGVQNFGNSNYGNPGNGIVDAEVIDADYTEKKNF